MSDTVVSNAASLVLQLIFLILLTFGDGKRAIVCDYMGKSYSNGERWVVRSAFVFECRTFPDGSWRADIIACQTPKGVEIRDGEEIVENNVKLKCSRLDSGIYRIQKNYFLWNISCEGHNLGDWWISKKNFNKTCTTTGTHIVNCLTESAFPIELNTTIVVNGTRYICQDNGNGTVILTREYQRIIRTISQKGPIYCIVNGIRKQIGETWIENKNFIKKCADGGAITIEACTVDGSVIDLNSNYTFNGMVKYLKHTFLLQLHRNQITTHFYCAIFNISFDPFQVIQLGN
ncbi:unnamed protein product [Thelazia callipaeda]|uniref:Bm5718 n=1 Tax=Thelazia callipaeda TaxID=103827 RepID=A0A158RC04_THECL|nr:unnamed protein product [Thelazia callipaeda]